MAFQYIVDTIPPKLDAVDETILLGVHQRKSLTEIGEEAGRSFAGVRKKLKGLEEAGYIQYNPGKARARMLTPKATEYLVANGLLKKEIFV